MNCRGITLLSVPEKISTPILLSRVKDRLLSHRRIEQSGFTPGRSTVDHILTLNLLTQTQRKFRQPLWIASVDFKSTFDPIGRSALWRLLLSLGLPHRVVELMKDLYTSTVNAVRNDGLLSEWLQVNTRVRQGCRIASDLLIPYINGFHHE